MLHGIFALWVIRGTVKSEGAMLHVLLDTHSFENSGDENRPAQVAHHDAEPFAPSEGVQLVRHEHATEWVLVLRPLAEVAQFLGQKRCRSQDSKLNNTRAHHSTKYQNVGTTILCLGRGVWYAYSTVHTLACSVEDIRPFESIPQRYRGQHADRSMGSREVF